MSVEENVVRRTEIIQNIFRQTQNLFSDNTNWKSLLPQLDAFEIEFRSIAYEAASMCIALSDFEKDNALASWHEFLNGLGAIHSTQVHVGLGWAIAQEQLDATLYLPKLEPMKRYRVMDGYGYYEGFFRRKKSINLQQQPAIADEVALGAYDQGLGRSMWYTNKANIHQVKSVIENFPPERQKDLWRGVGIACTYVGGLDEQKLEEISSVDGNYKAQLATGAVMATVSRYNAGNVNADTELICKIWCRENVAAVVSLYKENTLLSPTESSYHFWISKIESAF